MTIYRSFLHLICSAIPKEWGKNCYLSNCKVTFYLEAAELFWRKKKKVNPHWYSILSPWVVVLILSLKKRHTNTYLPVAPPSVTAFCNSFLYLFLYWKMRELPKSNANIKRLPERQRGMLSSSRLTFVISVRREIGGQLAIVITGK